MSALVPGQDKFTCSSSDSSSCAAPISRYPLLVPSDALRWIQGQTGLTEEMLQGIAARLEDDHGYVRRAAIEAPMDQAALSLDALGRYVKPLYQDLLQRSFEEHLYWYASDSGFIGVGLKNISLSSRCGTFH